MIQWSKNNLIFFQVRQLSAFIIRSTRGKTVALLAFFCFNIGASELMIHESGLSAPQKLGVLKVLKSKDAFFVITNDGVSRIRKHDVSLLLRKMNNDQLTHFLNGNHGVIKINQFTNGEFKLDAHIHGKGGGALGAALGVVFGKAAVSAFGHGTIYIISGFAGPAAPFIAGALEGTFGPTIEAASVHAAAVCGLAGAALTGPL